MYNENMKANTKRNDEIVALHDLDPVKYSFGELAKHYNLAKATVHEIYIREKAKRGDKGAVASETLQRKYPAIASRQELSTA